MVLVPLLILFGLLSRKVKSVRSCGELFMSKARHRGQTSEALRLRPEWPELEISKSLGTSRYGYWCLRWAVLPLPFVI